jgi:hypothetical protein
MAEEGPAMFVAILVMIILILILVYILAIPPSVRQQLLP